MACFGTLPGCLWFLVGLSTLATGPVWAQNQASPRLHERAPWTLVRGEQRRLHIPGLKKYSLSGTAVRVLPLGRALELELGAQAKEEVLVRAEQAGAADLWVWSANTPPEHLHLEVISRPPQLPAPQLALRRALGSLEEAEILGQSEPFTLQGSIRTLAEAARIQSLLRSHSKSLVDLTTPSEALIDRIQVQAENWIRQAGWSEKITVQRQGPRLQIQGNLDTPADAELARRALEALCPGAQIQLEALPEAGGPVHFQVVLLEVRRNTLNSWGASWPGAQDASLGWIRGAPRLASPEVALKLRALEQSGDARVLSRPELVVRTPGEAELFSGGELPVRTQTAYSSQVVWRSFGLSLRLKVTHATPEKVRLELSTEVSHLDPDLSRGDLPGVQSSRIRTQVDAEFGKSLFLSGLFTRDERRSRQGVPFLSRIPVLGWLFGARDAWEDESELLAILTPRPAQAEAAETKP